MLVPFIPHEWKAGFERNGFSEYGIYRDYWIDDLAVVKMDEVYDFLRNDEYEMASDVTLSCRRQSRGFHGENAEWFKTWVEGGNPDASYSKDCAVIVHREADEIAGLICVGLYGHESEHGTVLWVREIAVRPEYQGKGVGRKLLNQGLSYGVAHDAKRAFLMADELNANAIRLYKSVGFMPKEDEYQLDMLYEGITPVCA